VRIINVESIATLLIGGFGNILIPLLLSSSDYLGILCLMSAAVFNFGPQHPSTHGVLRLIAILHGEQLF